MFQLRAGFSEQVEWRTSAEAAREFFGDLRNFVELMPGVERITADARGIARWLIRADVPVVGAIRQAFAVRKSVDEPTGRGHVVLFAEDPNFRAIWRSTTRLFFNSFLFQPIF